MKSTSHTRQGKKPAILMTALLGAAITLLASGYFAMRAFAAGPSADNDYVVQYHFADGESLNLGSASAYGSRTYEGLPASLGTISSNNISLGTTAEKAHYAFRGWKVTKPGSTSSTSSTSAPYNVSYTYFVQQGESNVYLAYASPLWQRNCRVDYYVDGALFQTGQLKPNISDASTDSYPLQFRRSQGSHPADRAFGEGDSAYETSFCGWTLDPTDNGNKVIEATALQGVGQAEGIVDSIPYSSFSDDHLAEGSSPRCTYDDDNDCFVIKVYAVYVKKIKITYVDFDPDYSYITTEQKTYNTDRNDPAGTETVDPQGFTVWNASKLSGKSQHTTLNGHLSVGWYTDSAFTEPHYAGTGASATISDLREDTVLYARWFVRGTNKFYNNHSDDDTSVISGTSWQYVPVNGKARYAYTPKAKEGYTCLGWNTDRHATTGSFDIQFSDLVRQSDNDYENDFYAIWEKNVYTVDFIKNLSDDPRLAFEGDLSQKTYTEYQQVSGGVVYDYPTARGFRVTSVQVLRADNDEVVATINRGNNDSTYKLLDRYFNPVKIKVKFIWVKTYRYAYNRNLPESATISDRVPDDQYQNGNTAGTADLDLPGLVGEPGTATMENGKKRKFRGWSLSDDNDQSKIITSLTEEQFGDDFDLITTGSKGSRMEEYHFTRTLYAVWEDCVTIFYDANGGTLNNSSATHDVANSSDATGFVDYTLKSSATWANHTFKGWNTSPDGTGTHFNGGQAVTTSTDLYLYAEWEYNPSYYVHFVPNNPREDEGGTVYAFPPDNVRLIGDHTSPLDEEGKWEIGTGQIGTKGIKEVVKLYENNTGTVMDDSARYTFLFAGWTKDEAYAPDTFADKEGARNGRLQYPVHSSDKLITYLTQDNFSLDEETGDYHATVYAYWQERAAVTMDFNGGTTDSDKKTVWYHYPGNTYNDTVVQRFPSHSPTRPHHRLLGWNTEPDGSGLWYVSQDQWTYLTETKELPASTDHYIRNEDTSYFYGFDNGTSSNTLYAQWEFLGSYRIEFEENNPTGTAAISPISAPLNVSVNPSGNNDPFKNDGSWHFSVSTPRCTEAVYEQSASYRSHLFAGWTYEPYAPDSIPEDQLASKLVTAVPKGQFNEDNTTTIDGVDYATVKLYAYWQKRAVLYIDANGGTLSGNKTGRYVAIGNIFDLNMINKGFPGDSPRREGYFWLGWNTKADGSGTWYLSDNKLNDSANMTRIRQQYGNNPTICAYQQDGYAFYGPNNYEGTDDGSGTLNILYAQWFRIDNYRIVFDMNRDALPAGANITITSITPLTADAAHDSVFKTLPGDDSGERYWSFSTLTPYCYEDKDWKTHAQTYQFKGWSLTDYDGSAASYADIVSDYTVPAESQNATEDDENLDTIRITHRIPLSMFYDDRATIETVDNKDYLTITVHAVWKERAIVRFDANGGYRGKTSSPITEDYRMPTCIFRENIESFPSTPGYRRPYHKLIGYCTKADGSGTWYLNSAQATDANLAKLRADYGNDIDDRIVRYQDGDPVRFEGKDNNNDLYTMWREIKNYRIEFDLNLPEGVTSTYTTQPRTATGSDSDDRPFLQDDRNGGKYWPFSTLTPYARENKYGKQNLQTYQFKGWSLYTYTPAQAATAEIGYDVPSSYSDVDENDEEMTTVPENDITITNKVYKTLFDGADEDIPVTVYEDDDGKEYLTVTVHGVWKERAVVTLVPNRNQMGRSDNDGEPKYNFPGSIFRENITGVPGNSFTWKGHTFIGYNTERNGSGTYYVTDYYKNLINNNRYLPEGWDADAVVGTAAVFEGKDNGSAPNVLYAQWVRNYTLTYHLNYIDGRSDPRFTESGRDFNNPVNYTMMSWPGESGPVYPYHDLRDIYPSAKTQQADQKNYYFMGWSWEKIEGPVESYDLSKLIDRAEFNDLYEADESKWHFQAPGDGETRYHGDVYAVWSAQPYTLHFDPNTRTDSSTSKPKASDILTFPEDRKLSYQDIMNGHTFQEIIPTAKGYAFDENGIWDTLYTRKSDSEDVTGTAKNGSTFSLNTFRGAQDSTINVIARWTPVSHTVHYGWEKYTTGTTRDGIETDKVVEDYLYEDIVTFAANVVPPDYVDAHVSFSRWQLVNSEWEPVSQAVYAADGTTDLRNLTAGDTFGMPGEDLYFLAVYQADTVTVTYRPGNGTGTAHTDSPVYGTSHIVRAFSDEALGFTAPAHQQFAGWKLTVGGQDSTKYTNRPGEEIPSLTESIVYTAQYEDIPYTLDYALTDDSADPNAELSALLGESKAYVLPASVTKGAGQDVQVAAPLAVTGYEFTGWTLNGTTYANGETIPMPAGGGTLMGKFTPIDYTLDYITNRTEPTGTDNSKVGEPFIFQRKNLQKDAGGEYLEFATDRTPTEPSGYTFLGWATTRNGENSTTPKLYVTSGNTAYEVYGQWRNWNYRVDYVTAHGDAPTSQPFILSDVMQGDARISPDIPTESGYEFRSWLIENNNFDKTFLSGELTDNTKNSIPRALFAESATDECGVATANAQWNKLYRLRFDLGGGTYDAGAKNSIDPVNFTFDEGKTSAALSEIDVTLPTLSKDDGSAFDKWQLEIRDGEGNLTKAIAFNADSIPLGEFSLLGDRFTATLRALWNDPAAHSVTYRLTSDSALRDKAMPSEPSHVKNDSFNVAAPLGEAGYSFSGWYRVDSESEITSSTEQIRDERSFTMPDAPVTFWGTFTADEFPVQYYDSDAATLLTSLAKPYSLEVTVGKDAEGTTITPSKPGYDFVGWKRMSGSETAGYDGEPIPVNVTKNESRTFRMPAGPVKYRAVYERLFTLVYDANDANGGSAPLPDSVAFTVQEEGSETKAFDYTEARLPQRTGYRFLGWNLSSTGTSRQEDVTVAYDATGYSLDADTERFLVPVYAVWEEPFTVTYTVTGAPSDYEIPTPASFDVFAGNQFSVKAIPDIEGYDFSGWHYNDNGTDIEYRSCETFTMPADNVTFTGRFEPWTYTLYFRDSKSDADYGSQTVGYEEFSASGSGIIIRRNDPVVAGLTFKGWAKDKTATTPDYQKGGLVTGFDGNHTATVYALWTETFTVTYELHLLGGENDPPATAYTVPEDENSPYEEGKDVTVKDTLNVEGYEFHGWQKDGEDVTGTFRMPDHNVVLVGWFTSESEPETVTITYRSGIPATDPGYDASIPDPYVTSVTKGQPHTIIAHDSSILRYVRDPEKYEFLGWRMVTDSSGSGSGRAGKAPARSGAGSDELLADGATLDTVNSSVTLTAQWKQLSTNEPKKYKLIYNANGATGGTAPATAEYDEGTDVLVSAKGDLVRTNYNFKEWNTKPDGTGTGYRAAQDSITMPDHDVTLYAIWVDDKGHIPSPGTGESAAGLAIAFSLAALSVMGVGLAAVRLRRKREQAR